MIVVPATRPVINPSVLTDAFAGVAEVQVPPTTASVRPVAAPAQTEFVPVIGNGVTFIVTIWVAIQPKPDT